MSVATHNVDEIRSLNDVIRTVVRSVYDFQNVRIQMGNRITANWKSKLGLSAKGLSESKLEKLEKTILDQLRSDYKRITDGIINVGDFYASKLPTERKFQGTELISNYAELSLIDSYLRVLSDEDKMFFQLGKMLKQNPIYNEFLQHIDGIGPAMAGIILSEINIEKAEYVSSLWKYAGLDTVTVGKYTDENGKTHYIPGYEVEEFYATHGPDEIMLAHDKYEVELEMVGRSKKAHCLVYRDYIASDGSQQKRLSITFNPFLKTKLVGVMVGSFLKAGVSTVDGKKVGKARRLELAERIGFTYDEDFENLDERVIEFLRSRGYNVIVEPSPYARIYYDYKQRLNNMPEHKDKTDAHKHMMAARYCAKMFLQDYYPIARRIMNLPVTPPYAEAKLGLTHGVSSKEKESFYASKN